MPLGNTCYGAKPNIFGTVTMPKAGTIIALKLTNIRGSYSCGLFDSIFSSSSKNYWGCDKSIATLVTNSRNHVLLPKPGQVKPNKEWSYMLPNFNPESPYLILSDYKSKAIRLSKDEKLRIWFGEDFTKQPSVSISRKHCISVEAKIISDVNHGF